MGGGERGLERGDLFSTAALLIGELGRELAGDVARRGAGQWVRSLSATSIAWRWRLPWRLPRSAPALHSRPGWSPLGRLMWFLACCVVMRRCVGPTVAASWRSRSIDGDGHYPACRRQPGLRRVARGGSPDRYGAPGARDRGGSRRSPFSGDRRAGRGGTWSCRDRSEPRSARAGSRWVRGPRGRPQPERGGRLRHAGRPGRARRRAPFR